MIRLIANHQKIKIDDFYDMIFTLSVTLDNWKYVDRFVFLLDYGLTNIGNKKIAIIALLGNESVPISMFTTCQNRNMDFYFVSNDMPFPSNSSKLASFFVKYEKVNCKYLVKIDEDSLTDVSDFYAKLEELPPFQYLTSSQIMKDSDDFFMKPFIEEHKLPIDVPYAHEWECCVTTVESISKVVNNQQSMLLLRQHYDNEFNTCGDHVWAPGFTIAGIPMVSCPFISCFFHIMKYPHNLKHIHYSAPDYTYCKNLPIVLKDRTKYTDNKELLLTLFGDYGSTLSLEDFANKKVLLTKGNDRLLTSRFTPGGQFTDIDYIFKRLNIPANQLFVSYEFYKGNLLIYDSKGEPSFVFYRPNGEKITLGYNLFHQIRALTLQVINE